MPHCWGREAARPPPPGKRRTPAQPPLTSAAPVAAKATTVGTATSTHVGEAAADDDLGKIDVDVKLGNH